MLGFGEGGGPLELQPGLRLRVAFLIEHLGDQRDRGFGPRTEVRALDFSAVLGWREGAPTVPWADVVLFHFRSTHRQPEQMRTGLFTTTGRGAGLEYRRRDGALWRDTVDLHGGLYLPLFGLDGTDGRLWTIGAGGTGQLRFGPGSERSVGLGPRLEWMHRFPLATRRSGSALRLEAIYSPLWSRSHPVEHQGVGNLALEVPVRLFTRDVLLAPTVGVEVDQRRDTGRRVRGNAGLVIEAL